MTPGKDRSRARNLVGVRLGALEITGALGLQGGASRWSAEGPAGEGAQVRVLPEGVDRARVAEEVARLREAGIDGLAAPLACGVEERDGQTLVWLSSQPPAGRTLAARLLAEGAMDDEPAAGLLGRVVRILADLHARGLCHGELDATRVVVAADGGVFLVDPSVGAWCGQPAWTPSEIVGRASPEGDRWAVGLLAAEVLSGVLLRRGDGAVEHARRVLAGRIGRVAEVGAACLAEAPDQRPMSTEALAKMLGLDLRAGAACAAAFITLDPHEPVGYGPRVLQEPASLASPLSAAPVHAPPPRPGARTTGRWVAVTLGVVVLAAGLAWLRG